jgi:FAD/FMN-containing dehydrogenase
VDDIVLALQYATDNALKVIPAAGGHGSFVPIDRGSLYLDMRHFDSIDLDEEAGTVTFQGGVVTRDLLRTLGERGFYASVPNSNAVGMVG